MAEKIPFLPACPQCGSVLNRQRHDTGEDFVCYTCGLRFASAHLEQRLGRPVTAGPFGELLARERHIAELLGDIRDTLVQLVEFARFLDKRRASTSHSLKNLPGQKEKDTG